jgi:hypothetical protein
MKPLRGIEALPDRLLLSTLSQFSWQSEYRIGFAVNGGFRVYNVDVRLASLEQQQAKISCEYPKRPIKIGDISKICKIHYF